MVLGAHRPTATRGLESLGVGEADLYVFGGEPGLGFSTTDGQLHVGPGQGFARVSVSEAELEVEVFAVANNGSTRRVARASKAAGGAWRAR